MSDDKQAALKLLLEIYYRKHQPDRETRGALKIQVWNRLAAAKVIHRGDEDLTWITEAGEELVARIVQAAEQCLVALEESLVVPYEKATRWTFTVGGIKWVTTESSPGLVAFEEARKSQEDHHMSGIAERHADDRGDDKWSITGGASQIEEQLSIHAVVSLEAFFNAYGPPA